jgi:hypothetical protein
MLHLIRNHSELAPDANLRAPEVPQFSEDGHPFSHLD